MRNVAKSFAIGRLTTLVMCLALMVTGFAATFAMEHMGHDSDPVAVAWAASHAGSADHAAHHMPAADTDAECCEPEAASASNCHVSACCFSELQYSAVPAAALSVRSACAQTMASVSGPSIDTPLPERPPRLS